MPQFATNLSCTGCTACAAACPRKCITMTADADGFRYPLVDASACVECGLCTAACPVLKQTRLEHTPQAWAAYSKDGEMRMGSSSGGVFTELSRLILAQGGAVFGAVYDEGFRVIHTAAEDEAGLAKMRGAKYAQSDLDGIFADVKRRLSGGQQVLFSGTPCQVEGLISFLGKPYPNLTTVDFVCHSVPSPMVWEQYVALLSQDGPIRRIDLRAKDTGWSRYQYCHRIERERGRPRRIPNAESLYMKLFVGDHINRLSCAQCTFKGYARRSDLTIGDFWGIWDIAPEMDDDRGTSVVLVQSGKGRMLWEALESRLVRKQVSLEEASAQNGAMLRPAPAAADRDALLARIRKGDLAGCAELFPVWRPTPVQRLKEWAARILRKR